MPPRHSSHTRFRESLMRIANRAYGEPDGGKAGACAMFIERRLNAIEREDTPPADRDPYGTFVNDLRREYPKVWDSGGSDAWERFVIGSDPTEDDE